MSRVQASDIYKTTAHASRVTITCACNSINFSLDLALPAPSEICMCNPCRRTTGALYVHFTLLPSAPPADVLQKCTYYSSSQGVDRYFCGTCGTKLFIHEHRGGKEGWMVLGGCIDAPPGSPENVLRVEMNQWISDTGDGGLAAFLGKLGGRDVPSFEGPMSGGRLIQQEELMKMTESFKQFPVMEKGALLTAECQCGGVSFRIKRANFTDPSDPTEERYIPQDKTKYMAKGCVCRDCRHQHGTSLTLWWCVPYQSVINPRKNQIIRHRGAAITPEGQAANAGLGLTYYQSSANAYRAFCSTCGASAFYNFDDRPDICVISAGLMRAEEGIMARRWVSWEWGSTSFPEEAVDKEICDAWMATADGKVYAPTVKQR